MSLMKMERCSTFLNEGHVLKEKVCHKILFKIIIVTINGKKLRILVLMGIIIGKNLSKVGNNLNKVGNNLSKVGNNPKIRIPNLVCKP